MFSFCVYLCMEASDISKTDQRKANVDCDALDPMYGRKSELKPTLAANYTPHPLDNHQITI